MGRVEYRVLCNNGFTFVTEPGFIFFPHGQQAQTLKHQRFAARAVHPQGNQARRPEPALNLPPAGTGLGLTDEDQERAAQGAGACGKRGLAGTAARAVDPKLRLCALGRSFQGHAANAQWEGQLSVQP